MLSVTLGVLVAVRHRLDSWKYPLSRGVCQFLLDPLFFPAIPKYGNPLLRLQQEAGKHRGHGDHHGSGQNGHHDHEPRLKNVHFSLPKLAFCEAQYLKGC
jgi:hypothetical protein